MHYTVPTPKTESKAIRTMSTGAMVHCPIVANKPHTAVPNFRHDELHLQLPDLLAQFVVLFFQFNLFCFADAYCWKMKA